MKHYATIKVPAVPETTKQVVERVTCDLCGAEIPQPESPAIFDQVTIERHEGTNEPDGGGWSRRRRFDCCVMCFEGLVVPWIERYGASTVQVDEIEH